MHARPAARPAIRAAARAAARPRPSACTVVVCYFFLGLAANPLRGDARADSGAAVRATE